jgi:hypothetical protein
VDLENSERRVSRRTDGTGAATMFNVEMISETVRHALAALFALFAVFHALSPRCRRLVYRGSDFAIATMRTIAIPLAFSAAFLAIPHMHVWGFAFAAFTFFAVIATLLFRGRYVFAVLGMLFMATLPVAIIAGPLS